MLGGDDGDVIVGAAATDKNPASALQKAAAMLLRATESRKMRAALPLKARVAVNMIRIAAIAIKKKKFRKFIDRVRKATKRARKYLPAMKKIGSVLKSLFG